MAARLRKRRTHCALCGGFFNWVRPEMWDSRGHRRGWCWDCQREQQAVWDRTRYEKHLASLPTWALMVPGATRLRRSAPRGRDTSERGEIIREEQREAFRINMRG